MKLNKDTAIRRIQRALKRENKSLRISKSIQDKNKYGECYILQDGEIIADHKTLSGLLEELYLLQEGEEF